MIRRFFLVVIAAVAFAGTPPARLSAQVSPFPAQPRGRIANLAAGKFLAAHRDLADPNFAETVVLLVHYDKDGAMGLIINRQTKIPLSRVLEGFEHAEGRKDPVYFGGPVLPNGILGLLRSPTKVEKARHIFSDVYLLSNKELLEKALAAGTRQNAFRIYLGYSGWGAGQLEHELDLGMWYVFRGDPRMVFDPYPDSVWPRLVQRTQLQIARRAPAFDPR